MFHVPIIIAGDVELGMDLANTAENEGAQTVICASISALPGNGADPSLQLVVPISSSGTASMSLIILL